MFAKYDMDEKDIQEWKYILKQPNKKEEEAASRPDHEDRQSRSVQSDYQVCEDSHGEGGAEVEAREGKRRRPTSTSRRGRSENSHYNGLLGSA